MKYYGATDKGKMRHTNQDAFCIVPFNESTAVLAVVCDGMGGANAGNIASTMATDEIKDYFCRSFSASMSSLQIENVLKSAFISANNTVYEASCKDVNLKGMGTTAVAAFVTQGTAYILHVGDSRAYLYKEGKLIQLTVDHSMVQNMVDSGQITPDEALHHPSKNIITRALGVSVNVGVDIDFVDLSEGDVLLLCSDGLSNFVSEESITAQLENFDSTTTDKLIDLANDGGGGDNITAVVLKV